ncbi:MAG: ABC transporter ATP-binding protein [Bacilli bacterium]|nr:ABC transporter ATP-binding protein [Bacilli bacterium]
MNNVLEIKNLSKTYYTLSGKVNALDNINLKINSGEFIAIVGSSGCGKSTLLNILAGIDKDYEGKIIMDKNSIGYMLQNDALLPWLSIKENAMLAKKFNHKINEKYVLNLLKKYNLLEFIDKKPNSLSGGMRQRVALIRTLASNPKILLLDEPFSALDYQSRLIIENDVYNIIKKENKTAIIVTHDISEAVAMADKVIVLSKRPGRIKSIYNINLDNKTNPIDNRSDEKFNYYFNLIWKDLDNNVI